MDLKNFPMDVQTCTMQLESCKYFRSVTDLLLLIVDWRCVSAAVLQSDTPWTTWYSSGLIKVPFRWLMDWLYHSFSSETRRTWATAPNTITQVRRCSYTLMTDETGWLIVKRWRSYSWMTTIRLCLLKLWRSQRTFRAVVMYRYEIIIQIITEVME